MPDSATQRLRQVIETALSLVPAIGAMYLLFWLERSGAWTLDTPLRDVMTIACLVTGLGASFLLLSFFNRRRR